MESLKKAMKWDSDQFGREYDLERYTIFVVDDFNMVWAPYFVKELHYGLSPDGFLSVDCHQDEGESCEKWIATSLIVLCSFLSVSENPPVASSL